MPTQAPVQTVETAQNTASLRAFLHCPMCTHTVPGDVVRNGRALRVVRGQTCPRCRGTLDAAYVLRLDQSR